MANPPRNRPARKLLRPTGVARIIGPNPVVSSRTTALATNEVITNR